MQKNLQYIEQLKTFLTFESISADTSKRQSVAACARWIYEHLKTAGLKKVEIYPTKLHPIVYAEYLSDPSYKTILFYGHYDVQPVDPIDKWQHPPFKPVIINNHIYARGASDDKGQLFIHIKAIEQLLKDTGSLPVNVKCLFEGEEEIGSPNLGSFIQVNKSKLQCDVAVVSDTKMLSADQPAITYSLRGALNTELVIKSSSKDLHSGTFGGMIQNPAHIISKIISDIHDADYKVRIPGFYNNVRAIDPNERDFMKQNGPSDESMLKDAAAGISFGEKGYSNYERTTIRPSVVISGITSGYQGEGVKNVIPSEASVKINMRLVSDQNPEMIAESLLSFIKNRLPDGFSYQLTFSSMVNPVEVPRNHRYLHAAVDAYRKSFLKPPVLLRSGGTIPVVGMFKKILNTSTVLMGFALATDDMHAPNEKFFYLFSLREYKPAFTL